MKKIRGKKDAKYMVVKIHAVNDIEIVMSTSFAEYRIPRYHFVSFKNANKRQIQDVISFRSFSHQHNANGGYSQYFYWRELDDLFSEDAFGRFKVADE
jgi:hypothetical protein